MKTAVVIDDSPEMGVQIAGILRRMGLSVLATCETGLDGYRALIRHRPTIATVDMQMPGMDGYDVIRAAKKANLLTALVACSGTSQLHAKDRAAAAGACAFIVKPYDQVLVARELAQILDG